MLGLLLGWSGLGAELDARVYDVLLRLNPPPERPSSSLILAIDEESLAQFGGVLRLRKPLARALETLALHEPKAVAIDLVLSEERGAEENAALAAALEKVPGLVLAVSLRADSTAEDGEWEEPLEMFRRSAAALGHVHAEPDSDGVCRRVAPAKAAGRKRRWALALEAFRLEQGAEAIVETEDGLEVGDRFIPAPRRGGGELLIRYPHPRAGLERLSLKDVIDDPARAAIARGRVVFVGVQVLGGLDRYLMTPYSYGRAMSGVEINAAVYETLAAGRFLRPVSESAALAWTLLIAAALGTAFWRLRGRAVLIASGTALVAAHLAPAVLFAADRVLPAAPLAPVAWLTFLAGGAYHYLVVRRDLKEAERRGDRYQRAIHYVTHEMRTPLTAIQGSSELISGYSLSAEKQREIGALIHRESRRLGRMIEMFLSVERLRSGQLELRREAVDADQALAAAIERVRPLAERKRTRIEHLREGAPAVWGDREFLEYACYNLISNAVKYSPAQTAVTVRVRRADSGVVITVEDRGFGMDEDDLRNIFKKFYRAKGAERSGEEGTGLGLALVEEIIVQHGGSITVESRLGRGSRFTVKLPAAEGGR